MFGCWKKRKADVDEGDVNVDAAMERLAARYGAAIDKMEAESPKFRIQRLAVSGKYVVEKSKAYARHHAYRNPYVLPSEQVRMIDADKPAPILVWHPMYQDGGAEVAEFDTLGKARAALARWAETFLEEYDFPPLKKREQAA